MILDGFDGRPDILTKVPNLSEFCNIYPSVSGLRMEGSKCPQEVCTSGNRCFASISTSGLSSEIKYNVEIKQSKIINGMYSSSEETDLSDIFSESHDEGENDVVDSETIQDESTSYEISAGKFSRNSDGTWVCNICNQMFKSVARLKYHVGRHYSGSTNCKECQVKTGNCQLHPRNSAESSLILGHSCEHCLKSFRLKHLLKKHKSLEHSTSDMQKLTAHDFYENCGKCARVFHNSDEMEQHYESCEDLSSDEGKAPLHTTGQTKQVGNNGRHSMWQCVFCKLSFNYVRQLAFHCLKEHNCEKPLKCDIFQCGEMFKTATLLANHRKKMHDVTFECDICMKKFPRKTKLEDHMSVHTGLKLFSCDVCGSRFATRNYLGKHVKRHLKIHKCPLCNFTCGLKEEVTKHLASHSKEPKFICETCGRKFPYWRTMRKHQLIVHQSKERKQKFLCGICNFQFMDKLSLQFHQEVQHCLKYNFVQK